MYVSAMQHMLHTVQANKENSGSIIIPCITIGMEKRRDGPDKRMLLDLHKRII